MATTYLIGVDLGTTGTKTALFDAEGNLVAEAYEESKLYYPRPGWVEQDPQEIYGSALRTIKQCLDQSAIEPGRVAAIAFDGQMAGIATVDAAWATPTQYDSWLDTRCSPFIERLKETEERIIDLTGGPPTISHGAKILWWRHERPEVYRKIAKFVVPGGYVAGRMAGLKGDQAFMDRTYLHFTCFSDTRSGKWSDELLELYDVDRAKLPRIVNPWEVIGHVTAEAATACGLKAGTPIAAGCGDQAAGMLGAGMVRPGLVFDVAGTASVFAVCVDRFVTDQAHRTLFTACLAIPDLYYCLAYINGGGLNLRWFRDELAADERAQAESNGENVYHVLDRMASQTPPGAHSLLFLPHLGGRVCPSDANTRGVYLGLNWSHTKAHLFRAMLEGVAYEYAYYKRIVQELLPELELAETRVIGGGAKSSLWNQIKADVLGVPYVNLSREEFPVLGSAILAGFAVGVFKDLASTAESFVRTTQRVDPNPDHHATYQPLVQEYLRLLEVTKTSFDHLASLGQASAV
ncbi:MAG: xylulose kinase [Chloroflexi bacterium RBG_13_68_17]|nr:MAG: xylulose kinase [Chloroflexi bacterium RBG_13_68_17]